MPNEKLQVVTPERLGRYDDKLKDWVEDKKYAGSNSEGGAATSAEKLTNTSKIGDTNKPVYFSADGVPVAISYTIDKSVPSDAVFTDNNTTYSMSNSGESLTLTPSSGSAQNVSLSTLINGLSEGTSPATADDYIVCQYAGGGTTTTSYHRRKASNVINGTLVKAALGTGSGTTKFLREDGTWQTVSSEDTKVTQTATTTDANYEVLFSETNDNTTRTEGARKAATLRFNPNKGSLMEGNNTVAEGIASHAEGSSTTAVGKNSHASGFGTYAKSDNQFVLGKYNVIDTNSEYAFIIGGGNDSVRSNLFGIKWDGTMILNGSTVGIAENTSF